ncbi:sarcosine oxidase subunit gamma [Hoeflea sp. CAU 1731]
MVESAAMILPHEGNVAGTGVVTITPAAFASRLSLRARAEAVAPLSRALGVKLPDAPKTSARSRNGKRTALWLGPDEWLVIDETGADLMAPCAKVRQLHAAVDISHRNVALIVSGKGAEAALKAGCPQNLSLEAFPLGACSRTMLGKVEVVLLREEAETFRVEHWGSFSDYVFGFLAEAIRDPVI